jgi:hypothetical protein
LAGEIEYKFVLNTFISDTTTLIDIYIDNEHITTTEEHPFWVPTLGWVAAKDLKAGMYLQTSTETWLDIDKVDRHIEATKVYNFEVEGFHTYFVSELGFLVHNTCVETRINIADGKTRFTPINKNGNQVDAGFQHVVDGHFNRLPANSRSIFTITQDELKAILQRANVISSPVTSISGGQFTRTVDVGDIVGITALKFGGNPTSKIKIYTDVAGNLITTYPVP